MLQRLLRKDSEGATFEKFSADAIGIPGIVARIFARRQRHEPLATVQGRMEMCDNATGLAALSAELFPSKALQFSKGSAATPSDASRLPTLEEIGTGWLDCGLLTQMPSLHNFHEMAACAPDLVGVNFLPGGQLYGDESGPRWPIHYSLLLCGMTIDGRSYDCNKLPMVCLSATAPRYD